MQDKIAQSERLAMQVSINSIIVNLILSVGKLAAGILANSAAMISDAVHSASDVFSTFIVMAGVKISNKASDAEHQYGHERLECVAAIILAIVLALTGIGIGYAGLEKILHASAEDLKIPGSLALIAAVISIIVKEGMFWYTKKAAAKINSSALMADAWHHRSDAFSSIGALVGIAGSRLGFPIMDSIASLVIFVFIVKAASDIFKDAIDKMVDHSCDEEMETQLRNCVMRNPNVHKIDVLRTRIFGNKIYVDVEIALDGSITLQDAHDVAEKVHNDIEKTFPKVKHIMVHVNPAKL